VAVAGRYLWGVAAEFDLHQRYFTKNQQTHAIGAEGGGRRMAGIATPRVIAVADRGWK